MTIKKMLICSGILVGVVSIALVVSLFIISNSNNAIQEARETRQVSLALAEELRESSRNLTATVREFSVTGDERFADAYMDIVHIRAGETPRPNDKTIAPGQRVALNDLMKQAGFTKKELALLQEAGNLSNNLIVLETEAMNAARGRFSDGKGGFTVTGDPDKAKAASLVFSPAYDAEVAKIMSPFLNFERELSTRLDSAITAAQTDYDRSMLFVRIAVAALIAAFAGFLFMVLFLIVRPVLLCDVFARQVAEGNLDSTLSYEGNNEIGSLAASLRSMLASMRERISMAEKASANAEVQFARASSAVQEATQAKQEAEHAKSLGMRHAGEQLFAITEQARTITAELFSQIGQAEKGATSQQTRLAESTLAMEQLNQAIQDVARNTSSTTESADETRRNASQGWEIVAKVVASIGTVDAKTAALRESLDRLGREAEGIGKVMAVISDIADQTNLLALNAAIEAARAGDAGRGFAVVADEVRKLAEKTMQATGEVGAAVRAIQAGTADNIRGMQDASLAVAESTDLANSAGDSLKQIVEIAKGTAEKIHSIAVATEEQSSTCEQITATTESITGLADETLGAMTTASKAVTSLNRSVQDLLSLTDALRKA